ncbi:MAG: hypothetical protein AAGF79_05215 [Pseudomonadota bacterium]
MAFRRTDITNMVGRHLLPFMNPRVVAPPGMPRAQGRSNIVVATPMRSGTHLVIDTILNNIPAFRNQPLYIDLDQCWRQTGEEKDFITPITPDTGFVIKTHLPIGWKADGLADARLSAILDTTTVITVHREYEDVIKSLKRWHKSDFDTFALRFENEYHQFWRFWQNRPQIRVSFDEIFQPEKMTDLLDLLCRKTGTVRAGRFVPPPRLQRKLPVYFDKAATRLVGRHAPRINTTISLS